MLSLIFKFYLNVYNLVNSYPNVIFTGGREYNYFSKMGVAAEFLIAQMQQRPLMWTKANRLQA